MKSNLTPVERKWILYDVANSAFVLIVVTTIMPIFFKDFASAGTDTHLSSAQWDFTVGLSSTILAVLAPILGAFADYRGYKKKFWGTSIIISILFGLGLFFVGSGQWVMAIIFYIGASVGYTAANIFYDSFLPDVTTPDRMDKISSSGFAWGYIGSVIPFLIGLAILLLMGRGPEGQLSPVGMKIAFAIAFVWWLAFSIPMAKGVQQRYGIEPVKGAAKSAFVSLGKTIVDIVKNKRIFLFLLAYFFYIDGVHTIIATATAYGRDIGVSQTMLVVVVLFVQVIAWPGALIFNRGANRFGRKAMLFIGIIIYSIVCFLAFLLPIFPETIKLASFWGMAFLIACAQGGVQALSRSYFAIIIPPQKSSEYFGFYNVFGRFAAIMGPFLKGVITTATGHSRYGVLSLMVLFILGALLLAITPKAAQES